MILQKLKEAREIIKNSNLKKMGHNTYSNFDYYTPEQVEALVDNACKETNTIVLCNLKADEFGLYQILDFIDLENEEKLSFEMRTKHGSITATNETQQMGGTDTYSERYIKMKVFQIKDNNLDFDSQDNRIIKQEKKEVKKINEQDLTLAEFLLKESKNQKELAKVWNDLTTEIKLNKKIQELKNNLKTKFTE